VLLEGQSVVIIEDLVSTGGSSLKVVDVLRERGAVVKGMAAVFTYGFPQAEKAFHDANCELVTLSNYGYLIEQAVSAGYITEDQVEKLKNWKKNPAKWGELV